jgi:ABC-2 type transport system ATP-binding protein
LTEHGPDWENAMRAIEVVDLRKRYGCQSVLDGVCLSIDEGDFYALMGPNGSGKSTLSSIIASVTAFDSGRVEIYGKPPEEVKRAIGYVPQSNFSVAQLTGRENLLYFAGLLGYTGRQVREIVDDVLRKVGLSSEAEKRVSRYSGGMKKRLELATALFPDVRVLILDEPTTGLDPAARREFLSLVLEVAARGSSTLLITHLGTDAESASRVGLIDRGKILAEGSPEGLKAQHGPDDVIVIETSAKSDEAARIAGEYSADQRVHETPLGYRICSRDGSQAVSELVRRFEESGIRVTRSEVSRPTLEDVFFQLTARKLEEAATP